MTISGADALAIMSEIRNAQSAAQMPATDLTFAEVVCAEGLDWSTGGCHLFRAGEPLSLFIPNPSRTEYSMLIRIVDSAMGAVFKANPNLRPDLGDTIRVESLKCDVRSNNCVIQFRSGGGAL